jgi:benzylsuccinate CoA-transferase BbsE subunit
MESSGVPVDPADVAKWAKAEDRAAEVGLSATQVLPQEDATYLVDLRVPFFKLHTKKELFEGALARGFGWAPVNTPKDLVEYEQLAVRNYFTGVEHPELGTTIIYPGAPYKLSETPWQIWNRAPLIGEHNQEIYTSELGISSQELGTLQREKVI